jgi:hypothetical protein
MNWRQGTVYALYAPPLRDPTLLLLLRFPGSPRQENRPLGDGGPIPPPRIHQRMTFQESRRPLTRARSPKVGK